MNCFELVEQLFLCSASWRTLAGPLMWTPTEHNTFTAVWHFESRKRLRPSRLESLSAHQSSVIEDEGRRGRPGFNATLSIPFFVRFFRGRSLWIRCRFLLFVFVRRLYGRRFNTRLDGFCRFRGLLIFHFGGRRGRWSRLKGSAAHLVRRCAVGRESNVWTRRKHRAWSVARRFFPVAEFVVDDFVFWITGSL